MQEEELRAALGDKPISKALRKVFHFDLENEAFFVPLQRNQARSTAHSGQSSQMKFTPESVIDYASSEGFLRSKGRFEGGIHPDKFISIVPLGVKNAMTPSQTNEIEDLMQSLEPFLDPLKVRTMTETSKSFHVRNLRLYEDSGNKGTVNREKIISALGRHARSDSVCTIGVILSDAELALSPSRQLLRFNSSGMELKTEICVDVFNMNMTGDYKRKLDEFCKQVLMNLTGMSSCLYFRCALNTSYSDVNESSSLCGLSAEGNRQNMFFLCPICLRKYSILFSGDFNCTRRYSRLYYAKKSMLESISFRKFPRSRSQLFAEMKWIAERMATLGHYDIINDFESQMHEFQSHCDDAMAIGNYGSSDGIVGSERCELETRMKKDLNSLKLRMKSKVDLDRELCLKSKQKKDQEKCLIYG